MPEASSRPEPSYYSLLSSSEKQMFQEWGSLFSLTNNPPPRDISIGSVIMPTGDWFDRVRPSVDYFRQAFKDQSHKPILVISGGNSFDKDHIGASAPKIVNKLHLTKGISQEEKSNIIAEEQSQNAAEQARDLYKLIAIGKISDPLVLVVS